MSDVRAFSPKTLAERWDCTAQTIHNMIKAGTIEQWFTIGQNRGRKMVRIPFCEVNRIEGLNSIEGHGAQSGQSASKIKRPQKDSPFVPVIVQSQSGTSKNI